MNTVTETAPARRPLYPSEQFLLWLIFCVILLSLGLSLVWDQRIDWGAFMISFVPALLLLGFGVWLRLGRGMVILPFLAISNAIYIGGTGAMTILIYLRFPMSGALADAKLMEIDARIGYNWDRAVTLLSEYPTLSLVLRYVYLSSLPQLFAVLVILCLLRRFAQLQQVMMTGVLSLLLSIGIWWIWPSIGPSAYTGLSLEVTNAAALVTDIRMGEFLFRLVDQGLPVIAPDKIVGTIAFPSYHTVMALLVVWYLRATPAFWPALAINLAMVPAILTHGGHHTLDLVGGVAVFFLAAAIVSALARRFESALPDFADQKAR